MLSYKILFAAVLSALVLSATSDDCENADGSLCDTIPNQPSGGSGGSTTNNDDDNEGEEACVPEEGKFCDHPPTVPTNSGSAGPQLRSNSPDVSNDRFAHPGQRHHQPVPRVFIPTEHQEFEADRMLRRIIGRNRDFFSDFLDSGEERRPKIIPSVFANHQQCDALDGLTVLRQSTSRFSFGHSYHQPSVQECRERCWAYSPLYVYHQNWWLPVYQSPLFNQVLNRCSCLNDYCIGKSSCGWWWKGTCVPEVASKKLLVYKVNQWGRIQFKFVTVSYTVGCCCTPWGYGHHW